MGILSPDVIGPQGQADAQFQPYTITSGTGSSQAQVGENGGLNIQSGLNPALGALSNQSTVGAGLSQNALQASLGNNQSPFSNAQFSSGNQGLTGGQMGSSFAAQPFDINQATDQYFQQGMDVLNPAFQQQNTQLAQSLQGSGRGGLQVASGALGAGNGGMLNPDAYATGNAQSNALANLYQQSRRAALGEQNQQFGQALNTEQQQMAAGGQLFNQDLAAAQQNYNQNLGGFQANQGQMMNLSGINQQQMANLGLFGQLEGQNFNQGLAAEQIRTNAAADSYFNPTVRESVGSSAVSGIINGLTGNETVQNYVVDGIGSAWDSLWSS